MDALFTTAFQEPILPQILLKKLKDPMTNCNLFVYAYLGKNSLFILLAKEKKIDV
jgi:hypothetical protein